MRLSSQLLLTLRPLASKLPTLTRLPSESRYLSAPVHDPLVRGTGPRGLLLDAPIAYILSILNFMREQSSCENTSARNGQEVHHPQPHSAGNLSPPALWRISKARHPARLNRNPTYISDILESSIYERKEPPANFSCCYRKKICAEAQEDSRGQALKIKVQNFRADANPRYARGAAPVAVDETPASK